MSTNDRREAYGSRHGIESRCSRVSTYAVPLRASPAAAGVLGSRRSSSFSPRLPDDDYSPGPRHPLLAANDFTFVLTAHAKARGRDAAFGAASSA